MQKLATICWHTPAWTTIRSVGTVMLTATILATGCVIRTPAVAADWPGWRGVARDGKSPDTGLLKQWPAGGPKLLWQVNTVGSGYSTVSVVEGTVYTTGHVGESLVLFAFDLKGKPKWQTTVGPAFTAQKPGSRSTPMIDNGNLYIVSGQGLVGCYDAATGKQKWTRNMSEFGGSIPRWGYAESVLIYENLAVVTPGGAKCIVALDKTNGETVWTSEGFSGGAQYSSCHAFTYQGVPMIVNGTAKGIVCVSPEDGRVLWSNPFSADNTANCPTPIFSDGYVFWANGYRKGGICLKLTVNGDVVSAQEAWRTADMDCHHGGYIVHQGYIYGNHSGKWVCLDLKTGEKKWEETGVGKGSICFADGMLYLFGEKGGAAGLATCSPDGMQMAGNMNVAGTGTSWAHPVVINGRLYLRYDTNLYCFDVKALPVAAAAAAPAPSAKARSHYDAGIVAKQAGDLGRAEEELTQAIALAPDWPDAHWALAWTHAGGDDTEQAIAEFRRVIDLAQGSEQATEALAAIERLGGPAPSEPQTAPSPPVVASEEEPSASEKSTPFSTIALFVAGGLLVIGVIAFIIRRAGSRGA